MSVHAELLAQFKRLLGFPWPGYTMRPFPFSGHSGCFLCRSLTISAFAMRNTAALNFLKQVSLPP